MDQNWILYGTIGCHLCDEAIQLIKQVGINFIYIDIAEYEHLTEKYALTIPVLVNSKNPVQQMGWPFDISQLEIWLEKCDE